jgi:hypothetical protein
MEAAGKQAEVEAARKVIAAGNTVVVVEIELDTVGCRDAPADSSSLVHLPQSHLPVVRTGYCSDDRGAIGHSIHYLDSSRVHSRISRRTLVVDHGCSERAMVPL